MSSRERYLHEVGFRVPREPAERIPEQPRRRCTKCGAVLRRSNPGELCAPCAGVRLPEDLAECMPFLADFADERQLKMLARVVQRTRETGDKGRSCMAKTQIDGVTLVPAPVPPIANPRRRRWQLAHPADPGPVPVPELVLESETGRE